MWFSRRARSIIQVGSPAAVMMAIALISATQISVGMQVHPLLHF
jgi:hypothetical protein